MGLSLFKCKTEAVCRLIVVFASFFVPTGCTTESVAPIDGAPNQPIRLTQILDPQFRDEAGTLSVDFKIRNILSRPIRIDRIESSCGCSSAILEKDSLGPAEETVLRVTADVARKKGQVNLTTMLTADTGQQWICSISTVLYPRVEVSVDRFSFGTLQPGEEKTISANILTASRADAPPEAQVLLAEDAPPGLSVSLSSSVIENSAVGDFRIRQTSVAVRLTNLTDAVIGQQRTDVIVRAVSDNTHEMKVPVSWCTTSPFITTPGRLFFGNISSDDPQITKSLEIRHRDGEEFRINEVVASDPAYDVRVQTKDASNLHTIDVTINPKLVDRFAFGTLSVAVQHHQESVLSIPLATIALPQPTSEVLPTVSSQRFGTTP